MSEIAFNPLIRKKPVVLGHQPAPNLVADISHADVIHTNDRPLISKKRVDLSTPRSREFLSLADELPPELQEILDQLSEEVPAEWKQQARDAAYFILALDTNKEITDAQGNSLTEKCQSFVDQLASSGFVLGVYDRPGRWALNPKLSLPAWLHSRVEAQRIVRLPEVDQENLESFYEMYVSKYGRLRIFESQKYYDFVTGVPQKGKETITGMQNSKGYVEGLQLQNLQNLNQVLTTLREQGLHPHSMKLFDGERLVLYWESELNEAQKSQVKNIFTQSNMGIRAFGQDVSQIILTEDSCKVEVRASNDASLGDGGHNVFTWDERQYDAVKFLKQYLQMTYQGCKDPSEPYRVSFIPVIARDTALTPEVKAKIQKLEFNNLPTLVTEVGFLECFK